MSASKYKEQAEQAHKWWRSLQPQHDGDKIVPGDRAAIARLKRASSVMEALQPVTFELFEDLGFKRHHVDRDLPRAAVIAAVLAHVKEQPTDRSLKLAKAIGPTDAKDPSSARIKPMRLKRLLAAREPDDVLIQFRRTVAILGGAANVMDLAHQLLAWTDDERGDLTRTRFAFDYHGASQFAPDAETKAV